MLNLEDIGAEKQTELLIAVDTMRSVLVAVSGEHWPKVLAKQLRDKADALDRIGADLEARRLRDPRKD